MTISPEAGHLSSRTLNRFTSGLLERGGRRGPLSRHTVDTYVRNVNLFLNWARREGEIGQLRAQAPKLPRRVLDVLSREEIDQLEDAATSERNKVIVRVLADTGIRASELLGLRCDDLVERGRDRFLRILGPSQGGGAKGDKARLVPLQPQLYRRLQRVARSRPSDADDDWIFIAARRRPGGGHERLNVSGLEQLIRQLGERAGLTKRVYPHLLRHSFATEILTRGMDAITLSRILGHSSLAMIQRTYTHQTAGDLSHALLRALAQRQAWVLPSSVGLSGYRSFTAGHPQVPALPRGSILQCGGLRADLPLLRCRLDQIPDRSSWFGTVEPVWYYRLNEVVYQFLTNNGHLPLLAAYDRFRNATAGGRRRRVPAPAWPEAAGAGTRRGTARNSM